MASRSRRSALESPRLESPRQRRRVGPAVVRRDLQGVARFRLTARSDESRFTALPLSFGAGLSPTGHARRRRNVVRHASRRVILQLIACFDRRIGHFAKRLSECGTGSRQIVLVDEHAYERQARPCSFRVSRVLEQESFEMVRGRGAVAARRLELRELKQRVLSAPRRRIRRRCGGSPAPRRRRSSTTSRASTTRRRTAACSDRWPRERVDQQAARRAVAARHESSRAREDRIRGRPRDDCAPAGAARVNATRMHDNKESASRTRPHAARRRSPAPQMRGSTLASSCSSDESARLLERRLRLEQRLERVVHRLRRPLIRSAHATRHEFAPRPARVHGARFLE